MSGADNADESEAVSRRESLRLVGGGVLAASTLSAASGTVAARQEHHGDSEKPDARFAVTPENPVTLDDLTLDASASTPAREIESYDWVLTPPSESIALRERTATGERTTVEMGPVLGEWTIELTVEDEDGNADTTRQTVEFTMPGSPRAVITAELDQFDHETDPISDEYVVSLFGNSSGTTVTFDASDSFSPDGEIESYDWDGAVDATGPRATTTIEEPGRFEVSVAVTDEYGGTDRTTIEAIAVRFS